MIQDIRPHQYHNEYRPVPPEGTDVVFSYAGKNVYVKEDGTFPLVSDVQNPEELQYLFTIDNVHFFLSFEHPDSWTTMTIAQMRSYEPQYLGFAAVTGWQLYNWRNENRFCGKCGAVMQHDTVERAMRCPQCGAIVYPKIMPAVIAGVINDKGQIALTKYVNGTNYALIAGFNEIGETIEETVIREVKEEIGVDVDRLEYYKSQPWSFSSTLLFGFYCHVKGDDRIVLDANELKEGIWASPEEIPAPVNSISLTSEMMERFRKGDVQ